MIAGFEELAGKQLELGLQLLPGKKRVRMIVNNANVSSEIYKQNAEITAQIKGADFSWVAASTATDLDRAMNELGKNHVDYMIVPADAMVLSERRRIAELTMAAKLPAIYALREHAEDGGLMSYGVNLYQQFRRAASRGQQNTNILLWIGSHGRNGRFHALVHQPTLVHRGARRNRA